MMLPVSLLEKVAANLRVGLSATYKVVVSRGKFPTSRPHVEVYKQGMLFKRKLAEVYPGYDYGELWVNFADPAVEVIQAVAKSMTSKGS